MKSIWGKSASYKTDWFSIPLRFKDAEEKKAFGKFDLEKELMKRGYIVREPEKDDELRGAKGYSLDNARIIRLGDCEFTLNKKQEYEKVLNEDLEEMFVPDYISGFLSLSGNDIEKVGFDVIKKFLADTESFSYLTRFDIACDVGFKKEEDTEKALYSFAKASGMSPEYKNMMTQDPENRLAPGLKNQSNGITRASITASNGATVYIGGRESKFMIRAYNKRAEVLSKSKGEKDIGPLMRVELVAKEELAEASRKMLLSSKANNEEAFKMLWHNLADDRISIKKEVGSDETERLGEFMDIGSARKVNLDYTKYEGDSMEYEAWVKTMVSPKFNRLANDEKLTAKESLEKWLRLSMVKDMPKETKDYFEKVIENLPEN